MLKATELPPTVEFEIREEIGIIYLNRPEKRNAIDLSICDGLTKIFGLNDERVKAFILAGRGEHFSAGTDLSELQSFDAEAGVLHSLRHHDVFAAAYRARVPVITVLHGAVIGAGLELASSTHIRVAEANAYYALPEGRRGIFVGGGGSVRISRLIGVSRVMDMMMTGRTYSAVEGHQCGLSQYLVEDGDGLTKAIEIAKTAATNARLSNFAIIHGLPRIIEMGLDEGLFAEALLAGIVQSSEDAKTRLRNFLEKGAAKITKNT
jgi:enoyl-CoA hydratase/carnithine racemase